MADDRADDTDAHEISVAKVVEKRARFSMVWIFPLVAALLGGWLLYKTIAEAGVPIEISFDTASGLEAGKTVIKFKDVEMGKVDAIEVSDDRQHVVLTATIHRHAEGYLRDGARFWVVRPRVTTEGISGLNTLLSGAYIAMEPGSGSPAREFTGLETPPPIDVGAEGHKFLLKADSLGSVGVGSPVYFRGLRVGEVISYQLDADARISIEIFVKAPHHDLVWKESQFWDASGVDVTLDSDGMRVKTASLEALLIGGIEFDTPLSQIEGTPAADGSEFELHARREDIDRHFRRVWNYVAYFEDSVRGLSVGAPVELMGLQIGEVADIGFEYERETQLVRIPVTLRLQPERLLEHGGRIEQASETVVQAQETARRMIAAGMRAQLKTGSLLTGQLYVELVIQPGSPENYARGASPHFEFPTLPSPGLAQIQDSVIEVLAKIKRLPLDRLVANAADAAEGLNGLLKSPELDEALRNGNVTLQEFRKLATNVDARLDRLLSAIEELTSPGSPLGVELVGAMVELGRAARSVRSLTSYLERHPEALLHGKPGGN